MVNHILFLHVPGNGLQEDLLYNWSTDWSETHWPVVTQIHFLAPSEGIHDICLPHMFKNLLHSLLLFKDHAEEYHNAINHLPQQSPRPFVQPKLQISNLFKWSLIPTHPTTTNSSFPPHSATEIWEAAKQSLPSHSVNLSLSFLIKSSILFSDRFIFLLVFLFLIGFPITHQFKLQPNLCVFMTAPLQAQAPISILHCWSPLPFSMYFHFVFELSQEFKFPVQPSWPPATPAVSCTSRWSSCALRSCPWRSLPCPAPLSEVLLRKSLPKSSAFLQFC